MNQKYKQYMNYLHNELKVTKQDIKDWTREAVFEVAKNYLKNQFSEETLSRMLEKELRNVIEGRYSPSRIQVELAKELSDRIVLSLKEDNQ